MSEQSEKVVTRTVLDAIAGAALRGFHVKPGSWVSRDEGHVCLCGAVLAACGVPAYEIEIMDGEEILKAVAKKLGISFRQAASLNNGFEGARRGQRWVQGASIADLPEGSDDVWYNVGRAMRRKWKRAHPRE